MDLRSGYSISIACLLIVIAAVYDAESSAQETTLRTVPGLETWGSNTTGRFAEGAVGQGRPSRKRLEPNRQRQQEENYEGGEEYADEEEDEDEDEDEYEDELKAVAESHEAMSRDDTRNSNVSAAAASKDDAGLGPTAANNFDSHEVITANDSDEDVASNEAITDEIVDKYDQEVYELLKYKKERNSSSHGGDSRSKTKRVPTVKKELSTQKEILIGSNETRATESPVLAKDASNHPIEAIRRVNVGSNKSIKLESPAGGEVLVDDRYPESELKSSKKLDKRQETVLKNLKSYLLTEYATEEEQLQKLLRDLSAREDALEENWLKVLVNLAENQIRRERAQKLLLNTVNETKLPRNGLDPANRGDIYPDATESSIDSRKSRNKLNNKKKKKKKKQTPRRRYSTSTFDPLPETTTTTTTTTTSSSITETPAVQWRLFAERLFGPSWNQESNKHPGTLASDEFTSERRVGKVPEPEDRRLVRFGKLGGHWPDRREIANAYLDSERMPDYDLDESYQRLRYDQVPRAPQHQQDHRSDLNAQADGFERNRDYEAEARDFAASKSWPDASYEYDSPWNTARQPPMPISSGTWPWRQQQQPRDDPEYWSSHRNKFQPIEETYRLQLRDDHAESEKLWHPQRLQLSWNRDRSAWPIERSSKDSPQWQRNEKSARMYDREQTDPAAWEKGEHRSESNGSSTKQPSKEKIVFPKITMKTWNSLTSDPATWPHKLPGAKPWPKDENGKSYNPNADLVRKLGLDKQNDTAWSSNEETDKTNADRKPKDEKQNRVYGLKESMIGYDKSDGDKSNLSDYEARSLADSITPWARLAESKGSKEWTESKSKQSEDTDYWKWPGYQDKSSWPNKAALPKIQSVGAWVLSTDKTAFWEPYRIEPIEPADDEHDDDASRGWLKPIGRSSTEAKWSDKGSSRSDKPLWSKTSNDAEVWKSGKPGSWFAKTKQTEKSSDPDSWKRKEGGLAWLKKAQSWPTRDGNENSWTGKGADVSWSTRSNESWPSKTTNGQTANHVADSSSVKTKENDSWKIEDAWSGKSSDRSGGGSKSNEPSPWQRKINDKWNYDDKAGPTGTWPSKWKQFAYHRVTAMPISKPGTTSDGVASKTKNAFVAVSAVSSPKYTGHEGKKDDDDARNERTRSEDQGRSSDNQLRANLERPISAWKKDLGQRSSSTKVNGDPQENKHEALVHSDFWSYGEDEAERAKTDRVSQALIRGNSSPPLPHPSSSLSFANLYVHGFVRR
ncbi:uncharacterized protein LOC143349933 isoform X2 [Colletes latitarsis]|uniref:uncharacterized protein LOC143349933 isoform X2 n=1 Tax=Colletes latitarsis TaxID=2605962 RepID=UPI004035C257